MKPQDIQCSFAELEWDKILSALKDCTFSSKGKQEIQNLGPLQDAREIEYLHRINSESKEAIETGVRFPLSGLTDCSHDIKTLSVEGLPLTVDGVNRVTGNLEICQKISGSFKGRNGTFPELCGLVEQLRPHRTIIKTIRSGIDENGEILDSASHELKRLRSKILQLKNSLKKRVETLVRQSSGKGILQEEHFTIRNGRYVLPVKESHQKKIAGITHDVSSTGATLFIEPVEIVERNNEISRYKALEDEEIRKILRRCSDLLRNIGPDIDKNQDLLIKLEVHYACGMLSKRLKAHSPALTSEKKLILIDARHPVLVLNTGSSDQVIPMTMSLGESFNMLIISGPNAGGKTVSLKTVGLLSLMAQSGLPVPASPDSRFPVFGRIIADIGDRQSLDDNLSTFSARLVHVRSILDTLLHNDLILLDELGGGTDPQEGVHLAMALLNHITKTGALTVATTHHGGLKQFAHETEKVENASLSFDKKSLLPTFELTVGIPGSSYALELAKQIGLPQSVIKETESRLGNKQIRVEDFIQELGKSIAVYQEKNDENLERQRTLDKLIVDYSEKLKKFDKEQKAKLEDTLRDSEERLDDFNRRFENLVRELREQGASSGSIARMKREIRKEIESVKGRKKRVLEAIPDEKKTGSGIEIGSSVKLDGHDQTGVVIAENSRKKTVTVLMNSVKIEIGKEMLSLTAPRSGQKFRDTVPFISAKSEIDLRGLQAREAVDTVDNYLGDAVAAGLTSVRIIHGKGTGSLRKGIGEFLKQDVRVAEFRIGAWGEGDTGVTIVSIK